MFRVAVGGVELTRTPVETKLFLQLSVVQPMKPHVHGFGSFGLDRVVDDSFGCGFVCLDGRARLL